MFRILSVELWIVLIVSIGFAAISTTIFGHYRCTSLWQGYKTLTSSLTKFWAVILGWQCQRCHAHRHYVRCSSPGCFSLWLSAQYSRHFSLSTLLTLATKHLFKIRMNLSLQILSLPTHQISVSFSRLVTKENYLKQTYILRYVHRLRFVWTGQSVKNYINFIT